MSFSWAIGICVIVALLIFAMSRFPVLGWKFRMKHGTSHLEGVDDAGRGMRVNLYSLVIAPLIGVVALTTAVLLAIQAKDERVREVHRNQGLHDQQTRRITKLQRALREWKLERVIVSSSHPERKLRLESEAKVEEFLRLLCTQVDEKSVPPDAACGLEVMASALQVVLVPMEEGRENVKLSLDPTRGAIAVDVGIGDGAFLMQVPATLRPALKSLAALEHDDPAQEQTEPK